MTEDKYLVAIHRLQDKLDRIAGQVDRARSRSQSAVELYIDLLCILDIVEEE